MKRKTGVISSQSKRIIAAFGDIHGFGHWLARRTTSSEEFNDLIDKYYGLLISFRKEKSYFVKYLGDGFLVVKDLLDKRRDSQIACKMLSDCYELTQSIKALILDIPYPKPDGFRMRFVAGYARKMQIREDVDLYDDYVGYNINFAYRLLSIKPHMELVCHQSVKEMFKGMRNKNVFFNRLVKYPGIVPDDMDEEDLNALWNYTVKDRKDT